MPSEESDQNVQMRRLICIFAGRICPKIHKPRMRFGGNISLTYLRHLYEAELESSRGVGWEHIFITIFMKRILFSIITGNEKENSSQIYQTRAQSIHITIISNQC